MLADISNKVEGGEQFCFRGASAATVSAVESIIDMLYDIDRKPQRKKMINKSSTLSHIEYKRGIFSPKVIIERADRYLLVQVTSPFRMGEHPVIADFKKNVERYFGERRKTAFQTNY